MAIQKSSPIWIIFILSCITSLSLSQTQISGKVIDTENRKPLSYVNIGIKEKNIGTVSKEDGFFKIEVPLEYQSDSLTFSIVGYHELSLAIEELASDETVTIGL